MANTDTSLDFIPSPCIGVCKIPEGSEFCEGCLRTRAEIKGWRQSEQSEQLALLDVLKERRRALGRVGKGEKRHRRRRSK